MSLAKQATDTITVNGKTGHSVQWVRAEFGIGSLELRKWDTYCPYIEEGLNPEWQAPSSGPFWVKLYDPRRVQVLREKIEEVKAGRFKNTKPVDLRNQQIESGTSWISLKTAVQQLVLAWKLSQSKSDRKRAGQRLRKTIRAKKVRAYRFGFHKPNANLLWCVEADVLTLIAKIRSGKGRTPGPHEKFNGIFAPGEYGRDRALAVLNSILVKRRVPSIGPTTFRSYTQKLPWNLKSTFVDGKLPSTQSYIDESKYKRASFTHADLETLAIAMEKRACRQRASPNSIGPEEVFGHYGVKKKADKIKVARLLGDHLLGKIYASSSGRFAELGCRECVRYNLSEINRFLAGRNILQLAKWHYEAPLAVGGLSHRVLEAVPETYARTAEILKLLPEYKRKPPRVETVRDILDGLVRAGKVECDTPASERSKTRKLQWRRSALARAGGAAESQGRPGGQQPSEEKRGRGRPSDNTIAERNDRVRDDYRMGKFASIAELARHHHVSRSRAANIIHGRE